MSGFLKLLILFIAFATSTLYAGEDCDICIDSGHTQSAPAFDDVILRTLQNKSIDERVRFLLKTKVYEDGPNCWNTALYTAGHYPMVTALETTYVTSIFESNKCHEVQASELQKGDLGRMYYDNNGHKTEIHAFMYYEGTQFFQKLSRSKNDQYALSTLSQIERVYKKNSDDYRMKFYRCRPDETDVIENHELSYMLKQLEFISLHHLENSTKEKIVSDILVRMDKLIQKFKKNNFQNLTTRELMEIEHVFVQLRSIDLSPNVMNDIYRKQKNIFLDLLKNTDHSDPYFKATLFNELWMVKGKVDFDSEIAPYLKSIPEFNLDPYTMKWILIGSYVLDLGNIDRDLENYFIDSNFTVMEKTERFADVMTYSRSDFDKYALLQKLKKLTEGNDEAFEKVMIKMFNFINSGTDMEEETQREELIEFFERYKVFKSTHPGSYRLDFLYNYQNVIYSSSSK